MKGLHILLICLFAHGAAAQPRNNGGDIKNRNIVIPFVKSATECIAREVMKDSDIDAAYQQKRLRPILEVPMRLCADELDAMVAAYDRIYYPGAGEYFFQGQYIDDLPRAVRQRIGPELEKRAANALAARDGPPVQDKTALIERGAGGNNGRGPNGEDRAGSSRPATPPDSPSFKPPNYVMPPGTTDRADRPSPSAAPAAAAHDAYEWWALLGFAGLALFLRHVSKARARRRRREELLAKYGDATIADRIMAAQMWQGMTAEMLRDSWGEPADIGSDVYKTRTTETWKYGRTGRNRYMNRVIVENGVVVGHKQR